MSTSRSAHQATLTGVFLLALAGPLLVGPAAPARAASFTVTTLADVVDPLDGVTSLREAVQAANGNGADDLVVLGPGTHLLTWCGGPLSHTEARALTIRGNGSRIRQTCPDTGVIESTDDDSTLTLRRVRIIGGPNSGAPVFGPGVYGEGALTLDRVVVTGVDGGPPGANAAVTGSNNMPGAPVSIVDSTIKGNDTDGVGGSNVSLVLTGSRVSGNGGSGVTLTDGTPVTVTDSVIEGNGEYGLRTTGQGHTRVILTRTRLVGNGSTGLVCSACASLDLTRSTVDGNAGRGVDFSYDLDPVGPDRRVSVRDSRITRNTTTGPGAGISVTTIQPAPSDDVSPVLTITGSVVARNVTSGSSRPGGAVYSRVGELVVESSRITRNRAGAGGVAGSSGGGIHFAPDTDDLGPARHGATILKTRIDRNRAAGHGGGAYLDSDGPVRVVRSRLVANVTSTQGRGGGLWIRDAVPALVRTSTIAGNRATRGGGVYVAGRTGIAWTRIAATTISRNRAGEDGGGVLVAEAAQASIVNSTLSANRAVISGGGVQAGTVAAPLIPVDGLGIDFSTLYRNHAAHGGSVAALNGTVSTRGSVLARATGAGCTLAAGASLVAGGHTFTDDAACAGHPDDVVSGANPRLGPLKDNGGPTATHRPAGSSPLVAMVPLLACTETLDQRGRPRPQGAACEPGSVEVGGGS